MRIALCAVVSIGLGLGTSCKKASDPGYVKAFETMATNACACVGKPAAFDCAFAALKEPTPPDGKAPGDYEESMSEADQDAIHAAKAKAQACVATIKKIGAGG